MKKLIILLAFLPVAMMGYAGNNSYEAADGKAVFSIRIKGNKAAIRIIKKDNNKVVGEMAFEGDAGKCTFTYTANLTPGKYEWYFTDDMKNDNSGIFEIAAAKTTTVPVLSLWEMDRSEKELLQPELISNGTALSIWKMDRSAKELMQPELITSDLCISVWAMDRSAKELLEPQEII